MNKILNTKVAGVTYEGRQALIAQISTSDPCRLEPEPENKFDANAIAVKVAHNGAIWQIGYLPKELASQVAPYLDGENLICFIEEITGGFELSNGNTAALGVRLQIELPGDAQVNYRPYENGDRFPGMWEDN